MIAGGVISIQDRGSWMESASSVDHSRNIQGGGSLPPSH